MAIFTVEHDRLRYGDFPEKELEQIEGISVQTEKLGIAKCKVTISIDEKLLNGEDLNSVIFQMGMMVQMSIISKNM